MFQKSQILIYVDYCKIYYDESNAISTFPKILNFHVSQYLHKILLIFVIIK